MRKINSTLQIGVVRIEDKSAVFVVSDLTSIINVLVPIFDKYPLLTTKALDLSDFKSVINIKLNSPTPKLSLTDIVQISKIKKGMNLGRKEIFEKKHNIVQWHYNIDSYWLLGLVEGEGTFGIKNLVPYFQISQHNKSYACS